MMSGSSAASQSSRSNVSVAANSHAASGTQGSGSRKALSDRAREKFHERAVGKKRRHEEVVVCAQGALNPDDGRSPSNNTPPEEASASNSPLQSDVADSSTSGASPRRALFQRTSAARNDGSERHNRTSQKSDVYQRRQESRPLAGQLLSPEQPWTQEVLQDGAENMKSLAQGAVSSMASWFGGA